MKRNKILMSLLVGGLVFGLTTTNLVKASELEEVKENDKIVEAVDTAQEKEEKVETTSMSTTVTPYSAPADWAFTESSKPLHDTIINHYGGAIDINGDGFISISEANNWTGIQISFPDKGITGTLDGIEEFTNITHINLGFNHLSGEIPVNIDKLTSLKSLNLGENFEITGSIPNSITNMTTLTQINLGYNKLTGSIPSDIGNLINLKYFLIHHNMISGEIPSSVGSLIDLERFTIRGNNISGSIPEELYTLDNLKTVEVDQNENLTGNPAEGFENHPNLEKLTIGESGLIQAKPDAPNLTTFTGDDLAADLFDADGSLREGVTQEDIDTAQESTNYWQEPTKSEWQAKIDTAQELLYQRDAENAIEDLFNLDGTIKESVTQEDIDNAQDLVNKVTDEDKKQDLQDKLEDAQNQLDERNAEKAVDDLFNPDGTIKEDVTQEDIDNAEDLVNKLPEGDKKEELKDKLKDAQDQLDEKNKEQDAKDAVEDLFKPDGSGNIKDDLTQGEIDNAQDKVDLLPNGDLKTELQKEIDNAQKQLDEKNFVLLKDFEEFTGSGSVSAKVDAPVEKFSKIYVDGKELDASNYEVTSGSTVVTLKEEFLKTLLTGEYEVEIEFASGARVTASLKVNVPSVLPEVPVNKPSKQPTVSGGNVGSGSTVNTGDETNLEVLYTMLATSLLGLVVVIKRRKEQA